MGRLYHAGQTSTNSTAQGEVAQIEACDGQWEFETAGSGAAGIDVEGGTPSRWVRAYGNDR